MKAIYRLKKNYQYNYVYSHSESVSDRFFILLYCKSRTKESKIGFSVSKKYGKAVARNRLRRQMKSAVGTFVSELKKNFYVVIVPRKKEAYKFSDIEKSLRFLFEKAGLLQ